LLWSQAAKTLSKIYKNKLMSIGIKSMHGNEIFSAKNRKMKNNSFMIQCAI
jgi:hypothetical protein